MSSSRQPPALNADCLVWGPAGSASPDAEDLRHATDDLFAVFVQTSLAPSMLPWVPSLLSVPTPSVLISSSTQIALPLQSRYIPKFLLRNIYSAAAQTKGSQG